MGGLIGVNSYVSATRAHAPHTRLDLNVSEAAPRGRTPGSDVQSGKGLGPRQRNASELMRRDALAGASTRDCHRDWLGQLRDRSHQQRSTFNS